MYSIEGRRCPEIGYSSRNSSPGGRRRIRVVAASDAVTETTRTSAASAATSGPGDDDFWTEYKKGSQDGHQEVRHRYPHERPDTCSGDHHSD